MIFAVPDVLLLALVLATAFAIDRLRNLVAVVMLLGLYSLLMALVWARLRQNLSAQSGPGVPWHGCRQAGPRTWRPRGRKKKGISPWADPLVQNRYR